jgi:hypothetical protein
VVSDGFVVAEGIGVLFAVLSIQDINKSSSEDAGNSDISQSDSLADKVCTG